MSTIKQLLLKKTILLKQYSPTPQLDVEVLLSFALKKTKEYLYTHPEYKLTKKQLNQFNKLINRRLKHEPIAYLTGEKEFYGLDFIVNKNTLIPRPATEIMVEEVLKIVRRCWTPYRVSNTLIIDVGTGTGCVPIAIAKNLPKNIYQKTKIYAIDNSSKALNIAKKNLKKHLLDKKIKLVKGDLLAGLAGSIVSAELWSPNAATSNGLHSSAETMEPACSNLIITANLPYITTSNYKKLSLDIKNYEPKQALVAGKDGLKYYRQLFKQFFRGAKPPIGGLAPLTTTLIIEIDPHQVASIKKILKKDNFKTCAEQSRSIRVVKDLAGLDRVIVIKIKN